MTAQAAKLERPVEERLARLESHVEHMQSDIVEIKTDIRRLDQKIDSAKDSLNQNIKSVKDSLEHKIEAVEEKVVESRLAMERSFSKLTLWGFTLYVALAASLLGVMAKGFGWIK